MKLLNLVSVENLTRPPGPYSARDGVGMFGAPPIVPEVGRGSMVAPDRLSIVDLTPSTHMLAGGAHIWLDRQE